ncbi:Hexokinase [Trachipleistophora hominis]|uniref:Phosphotransferase n=1 Tax=Trachipleistophora hominis TaxID=72359 RepID=L7JYQ2_TRAHO|nr:Hexokinase [Trachipleistophora hominis]
MYISLWLIYFFEFVWCQGTDVFEYSQRDLEAIADDVAKWIKEAKSSGSESMCLRTFVSRNSNILEATSHREMLAIDFGGTSLKLGLYKIEANQAKTTKEVKKIPIPKIETEEDRKNNGNMYEWIYNRIDEYLGDNYDVKLAGLTFSYPLRQESINSGKILSLHKNFPFEWLSSDATDPVASLNKIFEQKGRKIVIKALANDTTATLMSLPLEDNSFSIGIVLGTGTNGAYFTSNQLNGSEAINTEWASFDSKSLKKTKYDELIQDELIKKKQQWKCLDCMLGGYKFLEILNKSSKDVLGKNTEYTLEFVKEIIRKENKESPEWKHVYQVKNRAAKIISALVFGILKSENVNAKNNISLILNGTILEQDFDRKLLKEQINEMKEYFNDGLYKDTSFNFYVPEEASLVGIIRILTIARDNH